MLAAVRWDGSALAYASATLQDDREVVLAAVQQNGRALQHASAALWGDREIVLAAMRRDCSALEYASAALWGDREILLAAVQQNGRALRNLSATLQDDREFALAAVRRNQEDRNIVLAAVRLDGSALRHASARLRADRVIVQAFVQQNRSAFNHASAALRGDDIIRITLHTKAIRLLNVNWLLTKPPDWRMPRRQALEVLEEQGEEPFVSADKACMLLQDRRRSIVILSHPWLTVQHPDPEGRRFAALRAALAAFKGEASRQSPRALFMDFASLPQWPFLSDDDAVLFKQALKVMGELYASNSTSVLKMAFIPPRPVQYDGQVHLFNATGVTEGMLWNGFGDLGCTVLECTLEPNGRVGEALVTF